MSDSNKPAIPTSVTLPLLLYAAIFGGLVVVFILFRPRQSWRRWFSPRPYFLSNTANRTYNLNRADYPFSRYNIPNKLCQLPELGSSSSWEPYQLRVALRQEKRANLVAAAATSSSGARGAAATSSSSPLPTAVTSRDVTAPAPRDPHLPTYPDTSDTAPPSQPLSPNGSDSSLIAGSGIVRRLSVARREIVARLTGAPDSAAVTVDAEGTAPPTANAGVEEEEDRPDSIDGSIDDDDEDEDHKENADGTASENEELTAPSSAALAPIVTISGSPEDELPQTPPALASPVAEVPSLTFADKALPSSPSSPTSSDAKEPFSATSTLAYTSPVAAGGGGGGTLDRPQPQEGDDKEKDRIPNWQFWRAFWQLHVVSDEAVVGTAGLDAYVHLLFLRSAFIIFAVICAVCLVIAIPLNRSGGATVITTSADGSSSSSDITTLTTLSFQNIPADSNLLAGHLILMWIVEFLIMYAVTRFWWRAVKARIEVVERGIGEGEWAREAGWDEAQAQLRAERERPGSSNSSSLQDVFLAGHRSPSPGPGNSGNLRRRNNYFAFGGSDERISSAGDLTLSHRTSVPRPLSPKLQDKEGNQSVRFSNLAPNSVVQGSVESVQFANGLTSSTARMRNVFDLIVDVNPFEVIANAIARATRRPEQQPSGSDDQEQEQPVAKQEGSWMVAGLSYSLEDIETDIDLIPEGDTTKIPPPFHPSVYVNPLLHLLSPRAATIDLRTIKIEGLPTHVVRAAMIGGVPVETALRVWCEEVLELGKVTAVTVVTRGEKMRDLSVALARRYKVLQALENDRKRWQVAVRDSSGWWKSLLRFGRPFDPAAVRPKRSLRPGGPKFDMIDLEEEELKELNHLVKSLRKRIFAQLEGKPVNPDDSDSDAGFTADPDEALKGTEGTTGAVVVAVPEKEDGEKAPAAAIEENILDTAGIAFVTFERASQAAIAARAIMSRYPQVPRVKVFSAPHPVDLHWPNLTSYIAFNRVYRFLMQLFVWSAFGALIFLSSLGLAALSAILTIDELKNRIPALEGPISSISPSVLSFIKGVIPTLITQLWLSLLPMIIRFLTNLQGLHSIPEVDMSVWSSLYFYLIWNLFLIIATSKALWSTFSNWISNPTKVPELFADAVVDVAPFYINYINQSTLVGTPLKIVLNPNALLVWLRKLFTKAKLRTRRTRADMNWPGYLRHALAVETPTFVVIYNISLVYSHIQPVVLVCATFFFLFNYYVLKYVVLYVKIPDTVSRGSGYGSYGYGGKIARRIVVGQILHIILMMGAVTAKGWYTAGPVFSLPLLAIVIAWAHYMGNYMGPWEGFVSVEGARIVEDRVQKAKRRCLELGMEHLKVTSPQRKATLNQSNYETPANRTPGILDSVLPVRKSDLGADLDPQTQTYQNPLLVGRVPELWLDKDM
ncbi:DUF221-domain-containing protein [Gonapodya prolifera JEL478]|uniref:DUF221-domain-containing protein n=1 Tax=Gonapodya prolifera (strain JEL478) TaxID=1344416 RepID=A0A139AYY8_GONPJ|nr:DUF221-domain-containing protein [Gonapodya prolifera JEL478]|eukprot:KXS21939.1 DUF221-domain-containing protein [Gonapodya prolifera JEL478]